MNLNCITQDITDFRFSSVSSIRRWTYLNAVQKTRLWNSWIISEFISKFMISCTEKSEEKVQTDQCCHAHQQDYHLQCYDFLKYQTVYERILRAKDCHVSLVNMQFSYDQITLKKKICNLTEFMTVLRLLWNCTLIQNEINSVTQFCRAMI